jgi:hypothetical protein
MDRIARPQAQENGHARKATTPRAAGTSLAWKPAALRNEQAGFDTLGRLE